MGARTQVSWKPRTQPPGQAPGFDGRCTPVLPAETHSLVPAANVPELLGCRDLGAAGELASPKSVDLSDLVQRHVIS